MRIRDEVDRSGAVGPWIAAARALAADGVITADAALFLVEAFLDAVTYASLESDPEMVRICEEMDRVKREHGLDEDEEWYVDEGPEEFERLNDEWERRDHENRIAALRALGHGDIADLLERDPEEFDRRTSIGHREFWGDRIEEEFDVRPDLN